MRQPLLDIVRDILAEMDSDEVSTLMDTPEAMQVAIIAKNCYYEMMGNREWPHLKELIGIEHSGDPSKPTHLRLPTNMKELILLKYNSNNSNNSAPNYIEIKYRHPDEFLRITSTGSQAHNSQEVIDYGGTYIYITNNAPPRFWTSFDDNYIVCNSYDSKEEDALQTRKTQALIYRTPTWETRDDYVPDLPTEAFPAFVEEVKSTAFFTLKQMANEKAEQKATRQQRYLSRKAWKAHGGIRYETYGRRSAK